MPFSSTEDLAERFGEPKVFMDVDAIEPGVNFVERIESAVGAADALVVIIGRSWLTAAHEDGRQRLDDPRDFVRVKVGTALQRGIRVIPVLVGGAVMPTEEQLPSDLAALSSRHALVASDFDWESGAGRLVRTLEQVLADDGGGRAERRGRREEPGGVLRTALALEILGARRSSCLELRSARTRSCTRTSGLEMRRASRLLHEHGAGGRRPGSARGARPLAHRLGPALQPRPPARLRARGRGQSSSVSSEWRARPGRRSRG